MTSPVQVLEGFQLSPQQKRIWRRKAMDEVAKATIEIKGPLDRIRLEQAINQVIERHEMLRTAFVTLPSMTYPVQQIRDGTNQVTLTESQSPQLQGATVSIESSPEPPQMRLKLCNQASENYTLSLEIPNVCADRGSLILFFRELIEAYRGDICRATGADEALQYADFTAWQHELLEEDESHFWQHLRHASTPLAAPANDLLNGSSQPRGCTATSISPADAKQLIDQLQALSWKPETFWFAAWFFFLNRYLEKATHSLCKHTNQRRVDPLDTVFGPVDQFLPIDFEINTQQRFNQAFGEVQLVSEQADEHSFSFDWANHPNTRDEAFRPTGFSYGEAEPERSIGNTSFRLLQASAPNQMCGLLLNVWAQTNGGFDLKLEYLDWQLSEATTNRLLKGLISFATAAATNPEQSIAHLPILGQDERNQLSAWNQTAHHRTTGATVHERFQNQTRMSANAAAICFGSEQITYGDLERRANQLAQRLCQRGVRPEQFVPLVADRSIDAIVGLLAILKSGGAFVAIDPQQPAARAKLILDDLCAPVGLIQTKYLQLGAEWGFDNADWVTFEASDEVPIAPLPKQPCPDQAAYLIYTSGSTGKPKGCVISHRSLLNLASGLQEHLYGELGRQLRVTLNAPLVFDASVKQWLQLLEGHTLVIVPEDTRVDGQAMMAFLEKERPQVLDLTPSQLQMLFYAGLRERPSLLPSRMLIGGEAINESLWQSLHELAPRSCFNVYGPSECSDVTTIANLSQSTPTIGKPIANTRVLLLDTNMEPVPIGMPGELCIAGSGVGRGYFQRPAQTAERFIPNGLALDPHATPGSRVYRSGDLARFDSDGSIAYLDRLDFQIKLRGFRVEPGEIEAIFLALPAVRQCIVKPHQHEAGHTYLVAYLVPAQEQPEPSELINAVRQMLPMYMVPQKIAFIERFPLTRNGKIDRGALTAPIDEDSNEGQMRPSLKPSEDILWSIWTDLLSAKRPGLDTSFFELGGHSLLATQLMSRLRDTLGVELPLRAIFEAPTIRGLAHKIEQAQQQPGNELPSPPAILPVPRQTPLPQSFAQQRLWFLYALDPLDTAYNAPTAFRIKGRLNTELLGKTLSILIERHEILRTTFADHQNDPVQVVGKALPIQLELEQADPLTDPLVLAQEELAREAETPFDLANGPLLRMRLVCLGEHDHLALFTMHHIIADAWSNALLVRELVSIYQALVEKRSLKIEPLPIQYGHYAAWQVSWLRGDVYRRHLDYWRGQLAGQMPLTQLPLDRGREARRHNQGQRVTFSLDASLSKAIHELGHTYGTTTYMTLLAGFLVLLYHQGNRSQVPIGMAIAGRDRLETESLIGCLINMLVLRFDLGDGPTFCELLNQVRRVALEAYEYQAMPFDRLVRELNPKRTKGINPFFQVAFGMQNAPLSNLEIAGLDIQAIEMGEERIRYDLTLWAYEEEGCLSLDWTYASALFNDETIAVMAQQYQELLQVIVAQPEERIFALTSVAGAPRESHHQRQEKQASLNNRMRRSRRKKIGSF